MLITGMGTSVNAIVSVKMAPRALRSTAPVTALSAGLGAIASSHVPEGTTGHIARRRVNVKMAHSVPGS